MIAFNKVSGGRRKGAGRPPLHPWDVWFKMPSFRIRRGIHYQGRSFSMLTQLRREARRRGLFVKLSPDEKMDAISVKVGKVPFKRGGR